MRQCTTSKRYWHVYGSRWFWPGVGPREKKKLYPDTCLVKRNPRLFSRIKIQIKGQNNCDIVTEIVLTAQLFLWTTVSVSPSVVAEHYSPLCLSHSFFLSPALFMDSLSFFEIRILIRSKHPDPQPCLYFDWKDLDTHSDQKFDISNVM